MRILSLSILAASVALTSSAAFAQAGPPMPPPGMHGGMYGGGMMMHHMGPMGPGQHFQHRLQRGFVIPPMWFGPQFQINNWQMYGFSNPGPDGRWVRYYDDAYLVDRDGRIRDSREGLDWDRYGEQWDMADGIPAYRGHRGYRPDDENYAYGGRMMRYPGPPMPGPGYGYDYGYGGQTQVYGGGYGYGAYAYPIVIETVTTAGGAQSYSEEVVEEYRAVRRAHHRARPHCLCQAPVHRAPRPRPPAGERG